MRSVRNTLAAILGALCLLSARTIAGQETVIHSFANNPVDGAFPVSGLLIDAKGKLYGTTSGGGTTGQVYYGTVFEMSPDPSGGWTEKVIHDFNGSPGDGCLPAGALIPDEKGNLYGITGSCGSNGAGTVFELSPAADGSWTETVIYNFGSSATDGVTPAGSLVLDAQGNLYGTTEGGGENYAANGNGYGTVFELTPSADGDWTEKVLYSFGSTSTDGIVPEAGLAIDSSGNLYGTTVLGGLYSDRYSYGGTVFELTLKSGGIWTEQILYNFNPLRSGGDGSFPTANLILDSKGNLYGTTELGGNDDAGTVFELSPASGGVWTEKAFYLYTSSTSGYAPAAGLTMDSLGNLYGTTLGGGVHATSIIPGGTVFKLVPESDGTWTETILHSFYATTTDGDAVYGGVIFDSKGNLYGTTEYGGEENAGTVFEIAADAAATPPTVSLSPSSLTFASTAVGSTTAAQSVTVTNTGTGVVNLTSETLTGTGATAYLISADTCAATLAASASCTVSVEFKPAAAGTLSAALSIVDDATGSPQTVALSGTGAAASGTLTVTSALSFAATNTGSETAAQQVIVKNTGTTAVSLTGFTYAGSNPSSFVQTGINCGTSLATGAACAVAIAFKPQASGALTASLNIADSATGSPQVVSLSGTGIAPGSGTLTITPASVAFAATNVGAESAVKQIVVKNSGTTPVSLSGFTYTGANASSFVQTAITCGGTLAAGSACAVAIAFKPQSAGALTATLNIADSATGSPQTVGLSGTGIAPGSGSLTITPTSIVFAATNVGSESAVKQVVVKNSGTTPVTFSGFTYTGANANSFVQTAITCGGTLAAGSACAVAIAFKPQASGALTATLSIGDSASGSPQTVALSGVGIAPGSGTLTITPASIAFVSTTVGSQSAAKQVIVKNTGTTAVSFSGFTYRGANASSFVQTDITCGSSLAAGSACAVAIVFKPLTSGALTAMLSIADSASGSPQAVALSGTGD